MKTVAVPIDKIVRVTENHGGYLGGECMLCGGCGWLAHRHLWPYGGYPYDGVDDQGNKVGRSNRLFHKQTCPMNEALKCD